MAPQTPFRTTLLLVGALTAAVAAGSACTRRRSTPPPQPYPAYPQQQQGYPQQPAPGQPAPAPAPVATAPSAPLPPVVSDPINAVDIAFLRGRAQSMLAELVQNLPAAQQQRVQGIPLIVDDKVGEVNAFAACGDGGKAAMAISDGLLDIEAHLAQARAIDELFGSRKVDEYISLMARTQKPGRPIVHPPPGFFDPGQTVDGRKVQRQHQILDEEIGFVMGHELGHHYLGHLPCTAGSGLSAAEVGRVLSSAVPMFNQPNELAADSVGVNNVLTTGSRRQGYHLTETGALLTLQFFGGLDQLSPADIFSFERTHPPAQVRIPVVQQTASAWRATGGQGLPILSF